MQAYQKRNYLSLIFYFALALLCTHEIDAVAHREWQLLPILSQMNDETGFFWFVTLHIPILTLVFWLTAHHSRVIAQRSRLFVCGFMLIHGVLHFALSGQEKYTFSPPIETLTVYGGAIAGAAYISMALMGNGTPRD